MSTLVILSSDRAFGTLNNIYTFLDVEIPIDSVKILGISAPFGGIWVGSEKELLNFLNQIVANPSGYNARIGDFNFSAQKVLFKVECNLLKIRFLTINPLAGLLPTDVGILDLSNPGCRNKWCSAFFYFEFPVTQIPNN